MATARPDWTREKWRGTVAGRRGPPDRNCDLRLKDTATPPDDLQGGSRV